MLGTPKKGARRRLLTVSSELAAARALFEPGHLGPVSAASFRTAGCGLPLSGTLSLCRALALCRPLLVAGGLPALRLSVATGFSAATATTLGAAVGIRIGAARLAVALMPAG